MLKIEGLHVNYGAIQALKDVSLEVNEGEIVSIVGANGAGKSTLLNTIAGLVKPAKGSITFQGKPVPRASHQVVEAGIALVPEGRRIFGTLTVRENLLMGAYLRRDQKEIQADLEWVYQIFPRMKERLTQVASTLSGGEQQMLSISRGLMSRPKLLLLDEPSLGLAPVLVQEIFRQIRRVNHQGVTVLMVEQNANQALRLAARAYVMQTGRVVMSGTGREMLANPEVQDAYLGKRRRAAGA
ncbi:MAG: ABC transporter ATP-binding protein [Firmicutes bacterium]|nr:ABC transporter ATP-binding protein [Bacillota bacterium]